MALHNHLLVNGYAMLAPTNEEQTIDWMTELVQEIDMKIIQGPFASYVTKEGNRGLTAVVMIETSHIAMHVWDEEDPAFVQFDLYTCSTLPVKKILRNLEDTYGLHNYQSMVLERSKGFKIIDKDNWNELE
jgi:S-adenosylmethionine/arginine decarboxylase-like enzyme